MPIARLLSGAVFAFWVSIGAAAPELIWQGIGVVVGHFSLEQVYSVVFIAMLLAFFVEPLMERVRLGRWRLQHQNTGAVLSTAALAMLFAIAAVCLHEAMMAYLGTAHVGENRQQELLLQAVDEVLEWAAVPFVLALSWLAVAWRRGLTLPAAVLACCGVVGTGLIYAWPWQTMLTTLVPCCVIALLGIRAVRDGWGEPTLLRLARVVLAAGLIWFALAGAVQGGIALLGLAVPLPYSWTSVFEDVRFYLGWSLGLAIAPDPLTEQQPIPPGPRPI